MFKDPEKDESTDKPPSEPAKKEADQTPPAQLPETAIKIRSRIKQEVSDIQPGSEEYKIIKAAMEKGFSVSLVGHQTAVELNKNKQQVSVEYITFSISYKNDKHPEQVIVNPVTIKRTKENEGTYVQERNKKLAQEMKGHMDNPPLEIISNNPEVKFVGYVDTSTPTLYKIIQTASTTKDLADDDPKKASFKVVPVDEKLKEKLKNDSYLHLEIKVPNKGTATFVIKEQDFRNPAIRNSLLEELLKSGKDDKVKVKLDSDPKKVLLTKDSLDGTFEANFSELKDAGYSLRYKKTDKGYDFILGKEKIENNTLVFQPTKFKLTLSKEEFEHPFRGLLIAKHIESNLPKLNPSLKSETVLPFQPRNHDPLLNNARQYFTTMLSKIYPELQRNFSTPEFQNYLGQELLKQRNNSKDHTLFTPGGLLVVLMGQENQFPLVQAEVAKRFGMRIITVESNEQFLAIMNQAANDSDGFKIELRGQKIEIPKPKSWVFWVDSHGHTQNISGINGHISPAQMARALQPDPGSFKSGKQPYRNMGIIDNACMQFTVFESIFQETIIKSNMPVNDNMPFIEVVVGSQPYNYAYTERSGYGFSGSRFQSGLRFHLEGLKDEKNNLIFPENHRQFTHGDMLSVNQWIKIKYENNLQSPSSPHVFAPQIINADNFLRNSAEALRLGGNHPFKNPENHRKTSRPYIWPLHL